MEILTETGEPVPRLRRTVALCRCGASSIKPYCDGTHKLTGFTTGLRGSTKSRQVEGMDFSMPRENPLQPAVVPVGHADTMQQHENPAT